MSVFADSEGCAPQSSVGVEAIIVCALLVLFTGVHLPLLFGEWPETGAAGIESAERIQALRLASLPLYALIGILAAFRLRLILERAWTARWICLLTILAVMSVAWSISPDDTLRRSVALLMTTLFALYLAASFDHLALVRLFGIALTIVVTLGLTAAIVSPEMAIMQEQHGGSLRGLFTNKNAFGYMAGLDILVLAAWLAAEPRRIGSIGISMLAALAALFLSRSLTSILMVLAAGVMCSAVAALRAREGASIHATLLCTGVALAMLFVAIVPPGDLLSMIGRDSTLTGRTMIWAESWEFIRERPFIGYGYGAFWSESSDPMAILQAAVGWSTPNAHSGYVDLWLQLGLFGVCLFAAVVLQALVGLAHRIRLGEPAGVYATALIGAGLLVQALSENSLLRQNDIGWLLFVTFLASVDRIHRRHVATPGYA